MKLFIGMMLISSYFKSPIKGELTLVVSEIDKKRLFPLIKKKLLTKQKNF